MIIVCSGPDTYRAREKARELAAVFRVKHDSEGLAMDTIDGSEGIAALLPRIGSPSLFTVKRLVRADGCLAKMKISEVRQLAAKLATDKDATILLTVEDEAPTAKVLEALKDAPLFHYSFATQRGAAFLAWMRERAVRVGVDTKRADALAEAVDGDTWLAVQELAKLAVYPDAPVYAADTSEAEIFAVADAAIQETSGWRRLLSSCEDDGALIVLSTQIRSFMRVRDNSVDGLHPFVAKKLKGLRASRPIERYVRIMRALALSRSGLAIGREVDALL